MSEQTPETEVSHVDGAARWLPGRMPHVDGAAVWRPGLPKRQRDLRRAWAESDRRAERRKQEEEASAEQRRREQLRLSAGEKSWRQHWRATASAFPFDNGLSLSAAPPSRNLANVFAATATPREYIDGGSSI